MSLSNQLSNQVALNEAVAEVSHEPIKKYVKEGVGYTNKKPVKCSKHKQTIGASEIDVHNTISESVQIIDQTVGVNNLPKIDGYEISESFVVNRQSRKTYERKRSRNAVPDDVTLREKPIPQETDNLEYFQQAVKSIPVCRANIDAGKGVKCSEIVDQEISESFEVNRQSRKTYERKRSRNAVLDNITLREEPLPQETDNLEYSQKTMKRVPVCRAIINAGKGVKGSEIVDNEIRESFERQSRREEAKSPETDSLEQSQNAMTSVSQSSTIISARRGVRKPQRRTEDNFESSASRKRSRSNEELFTPDETISSTRRSVGKHQRRTEDKFESCESRERWRLNEELITPDELACLEKAGIPHPISSEQLVSITEAVYKEYHSEIVVCAVCDEMFSHSETKLLSAVDLPISFFSVLRKPSGSCNEVPALHPLLLQQYDVSHYFPADPRFQGLLISPRGLEIHRKNCLVKNQNCCECQLYICVTNGCLTALQHNKIPKFAIAHGNYIGQLPQAFREMTFASRSLIRPVTSFGRMACYSDTSGTRLTGHVYSNRLNTALVRQKLPMAPATTAIRVLIVSPMASDQTAVSRGKMASVKSDYIIESEKIASSLRFFRDVGNKVMKNVEIDQDAINNLPSDKTSVDMLFTTEQETEDSHQDPDLVQSVEFDNGTGGPSLSRSNEEFLDGVFESATVTIGAVEPEKINDHGKIARVLHTILDEGTFPNEVTSKDDLGTNKSSSTYIVRPEKEFMSDSNPDYLELHYPDLFPFGCGGFGEQRKNPISRKALVQHLLNLSSRQFQQVDFVLPIYDMVTRQQVSNMAYVRSILPSRLSGSERGTINSKGEVYGRVSMEDLRAAHGYKVTCAEAASQGCRFPLPPASLNGLAIDFFTDIGISTQPMQHSQAAANRNRQKVYAAHNSLGKAQIWFTVSPDDTQSFKIVVNALGSQAVNFENPVPTGEKRFKLLAKHPVAAALHFQRILKMVIKKVLGWNRSQLLPYRSGGVFGVPKGYLYLVEEQSRLTLHAHFLIWLYGHENIERQLLRASRLDEEERKANDVSHNVHELFQRTVGANDEDHLTHLAKFYIF